ncbi:MAG: hypothetical protein P4L67_01865 [Candidatus Pacebacteria bacterium]|nr:hypothetical protein [Candidatus Paceibacterota bacterium]
MSKARKEKWSAVPKEDRREPVREYIKNTRNILLSKIAMQDKEKEAKRMQEYIERKESILNLNKEIYEQDKKMVNEYVEFMKDKAEKQKAKADAASKLRKEMESELENLIKHRTELKKTIGDYKEECTVLKDYAKFTMMLSPAVKEEMERRKKKREERSVFLTQQRAGDDPPKFEPVDEELKEIKHDFDLDENDSDTEIPKGFNSVEEMLELMQVQAAKNLSLIQNVQELEKQLDESRKQTAQKMAEKTKILETIKADLRDLAEEERRKQARLNEINASMVVGVLDSASAALSSAEDRKEQIECVRALKEKIRRRIYQIYSICTAGKLIKDKKFIEDLASGRSITGALTYITEYLVKMKMIRDNKFKAGKGSEQLGIETKVNDELKQERAEAGRKKKQNDQEKKRAKMIDNLKLKRTRKYGKEAMYRKVLHAGPRRKANDGVKKTEDEFDDKYFVE